MSSFVCRVQFLDDTDPFNSTNFPEPTRAPLYTFREDIPLINQLAGVHRLLKAPHKLDDCALQLSHTGVYLDLESTLDEQRDELEGFLQDDCAGRGKKHSVILRTQLSVRVHACIEKLYNSNGRDLRRALFSLKQIFQDDKDLVHEFVMAEGLTCLIKVGAEADQNYQNYILRALGQIMLYVDGMNGVIGHTETIQWLYLLTGSKFRLVVKTSLKLLLVFVEYSESNAPLLIQAIDTVDTKRGCKQWSNAMEILAEKDGVDTELLVYVMTLINKTLAALPDQDSFYDTVDVLEEQGIESVSQRYLGRKGTDLDLLEQLNIYEATLRHEDGDEDALPPSSGRRDRRHSSVGGAERRGLERRRSRRHSLGRSGHASPHRANSQLFNGQELDARAFSAVSSSSTPNKQHSDRPALGGLLSSSYRQHQESLAAERERRRVEREERLQRIEREERNRHSRDYVSNMEEARHAREERFRTAERLAVEEFERERMHSAARGLNLTLSPTDTCQSSCSATPSSVTSSDEQDTPITSYPPSEPDTTDLEPDVEANLEPEEKDAEAREEQEEEVEEIRAEQEVDGAEERAEEEEEGSEQETADGEAEDSGILSDKERQNEEVNEKDNCSASSISSASSTLEREETGQWSAPSVTDVNVSEQRNKILNSKLFMLDMLYSQSKRPSEEDEDEDELAEDKERDAKEKAEDSSQDVTAQEEISAKSEGDEKVENQSNVRAFAERFGDVVKGLTSPPIETHEPPPPPPPPKKESDCIWDQLMASPRELRIGDIDFTDLGDEDDKDALDSGSLYNSGNLLAPPPPPPPCPFNLPAPPPMFGCPPPPPMFSIRVPPPPPCFSIQAPPPPQQEAEQPPLFQKKKKTIRLFWSEVRPADWIYRNHKRSQESLWSRLEPVKVDTAKLEHLFESKSKEMPVTKKVAADGKRQEIIILDSKRSNSINIGLTVLPPPRTIKTAILSFDEYALNKEGIEKILTMIPTEEETQKIQEAQLMNPDIPLGSAEQFLLTLSSISELSARLQLWAFKLDYEASEKEVAEPLQDLKEGMDQLEKNKTLRFILSTLLAIGNFLNGSNAKGFDLTYLEKVPEVKDTVHKQSLLHHVCSIVVENFPDSTDLYSEIGAVTRSAKVDFEQLQETLTQMEWRCKASWDHLKVIAKHEMKPALKQKMSDFLKDCAERIIILKTVHRRIMNRFHSFLLFLGQPVYSVRDISVTRFSKLLSEFALEYRTTRERVLQQRQKRADHRERNKTRGKMITDISTPTDDEEDSETGRVCVSSISTAPAVGPHTETQTLGLCQAEDAAEHEQMKAVLKSSQQRDRDRDSTGITGLRTRTRTRASRGRSAWAAGTEESQCVTDDAADEIMERIVRSATQSPRERAQPRERRRSRANRKSLRRTLKGGLTAEEAQALGLDASEMPV
ncbi:FH1/FH2 domain-containing protein 3 isoform X3 [Carassius gibelio]|uniref:FH1/FH2 domain-containing protein 3 isoform X3 n=1 Tax=Carassius gibelio TaxID=101364 RepID=UPI002277DC2B|nr:FH1/FH2 domain-containing protein 3 isoform X3 [Carassius gibelio]